MPSGEWSAVRVAVINRFAVFILVVVIAMAAASAACQVTPKADVRAVEVRMVAHWPTWNATYLIEEPHGPAMEIPTGREVHVPLGATVTLALVSPVFISDFRLPALGLRDFAAPGLPSTFRFRADRPGRYRLQGDELWGRPHHERSRRWRVVGDPAFSGTHERAPDGFLLAFGEAVAPGRPQRGSIVDVTPTVLYFFGLPVARDMDGFARSDLFTREFTAERPVTFISSYR